jgi:hypothetical protein
VNDTRQSNEGIIGKYIEMMSQAFSDQQSVRIEKPNDRKNVIGRLA